MIERISYLPVKQKIFTTLLFTCIFFSVFNFQTQAQGWGFTINLGQSGPCGSGLPSMPLPAIPNVIPTQVQCEALRQQILATTRQCFPVFDGSKYLGECCVFVTCTPCTGSDMVIQGQVSPGEISLDGQFTGKPLFTTHESAAFEDWATDYKQQLAAYGITSILGNTLTPPKIPLTGDKGFDDFYTSQTANFNPKTPALKPAPRDASVVDLSGKTGTVQLLTNSAEQAKRDKWYEEKGFNNLTPITADAGIDENSPAQMSLKEKSLRFTLENIPVAGTIATGMLNMVDVVFGENGLPKAIDQATKMDYQGGVETSNNMQAGIRNATATTMVKTIENKFTDGFSGAVSSSAISKFGIGDKGEKAVGIVTGSVDKVNAWKEK